MQGVRGGELFYIPGGDDNIVVRFKRVDPSYFSALDIPVVNGRPITNRDRADSTKVVVVNQVLAQLLSSKYGIADPIGRTFRMTAPGYGKEDGAGADLQVIGVIRNERTGDLQQPLDPVVYVPLDQYPREDFRILARTQQEPTAVVSGIREALRQLDPKLGLADIRTMEEVKQRNLTWARQPAWLIGAFALVAALLAALGLYGVLSHSVVQQRREIGIRMALGATAGKVLSRVLRNAFALVASGLAIGVCGAMALTRLMKALLFNVSPLDPVAMAAAMTSMIAVGLLAGFLPAHRAAKVDPMTTLREE
jgi:putative ABC transport system permease protein